MEQYHQLLRDIKEKGTHKALARENMPGTLSLFGYQNRYNLQEGFPILTTKKVNFKHIVTELLWFLRGDTNVKYLIDNGCNIWNEDAYNYYKKVHKQYNVDGAFTFDEFVNHIKIADCKALNLPEANYKLGDCGKQYGWLWRNWDKEVGERPYDISFEKIDQIQELINGLKNNPMGRRHILSAWNPSTLNDMALNACHAFVQFNCRPYFSSNGTTHEDAEIKHYLDCQMYQRSADAFLGVPYNIASYALLTHILAKICNMEVGDLIISYGDVHIYDNHMEAVDEILTRTPTKLPKLDLSSFDPIDIDDVPNWDVSVFKLENYNPQSSIKAKLSTGLK